MQQPIYWPAALPSNPRTYQKAYDSIRLKSSQGNHPQDDLDDIFGKGRKPIIQLEIPPSLFLNLHYTDDRVNDYRHYALDAVHSCSKYADMGAQVTKISKSSELASFLPPNSQLGQL